MTKRRRHSADALLRAYSEQRSPEILDELVACTMGDLLRDARLRVPDPLQAEDLVQETYLALLDSKVHFDASRSAMPYLLGVLRKKELQMRRRERKSGPLPELVSHQDPHRLVERAELVALVEATLSQMSSRDREVLVPYLYSQQTPREIGRDFGRTTGSVRVHIHRALRRLRGLCPAAFTLANLRAALLPPIGVPWSPANTGVHAARGTVVLGLLAVGVLLSGGLIHGLLHQAARPMLSAPQVGAGLVGMPRGGERAGQPLDDRPPIAPRSRVARSGACLEVRFVWEDDETPAKGVGVQLMPVRGLDPFLHTQRRATGGSGRVVFENLPAGMASVWDDRGGRRQVELVAGSNRQLRVRLKRGLRVDGIVKTMDGIPQPGAAIWLADSPSTMWEGQAVIYADADGRFELDGLSPSSWFAAHAENHVPSPLQCAGKNRHQTVELVVGGSGATLTGLVCDSGGVPLADVRIVLGERARHEFKVHENALFSVPPNRFVQTDCEGKFCLRDLPSGRMEAVFRRRGCALQHRSFDLCAGETRSIRVEMGAAPAVAGRICDADGQPVRGALVQVRCGPRYAWGSARTTTAGSFRVEGLLPGPGSMVVQAPGFETAQLDYRDASTPVDIRLARARIHRGRLLPAASNRLEGSWQVCAATPERILCPPIRVAAHGIFAAPHLPVAEPLWFARRGDVGIWLRCSCLDEASGLVLQLPPSAHSALGGLRVRFPAAAAMADAELIAYRDRWSYVLEGAPGPDDQTLDVQLPVGVYHLLLQSVNGKSAPMDLGRVRIDSGSQRELSIPTRATGRLRYHLELPSGCVPSTFFVNLCLPGGAWVRLGQREGTQELHPGRYRMSVLCDGMQQIRPVCFEIEAGRETSVDVPLVPGYPVHVVVTLPESLRPRAFTCRLAHAEGWLTVESPVVRQPDGGYVLLHQLCAGTYDARATVSGHELQGTLEVSEQGTGASCLDLKLR